MKITVEEQERSFIYSQLFKVEYDAENIEDIITTDSFCEDFEISGLSFEIKKLCFETGLHILLETILGVNGELT